MAHLIYLICLSVYLSISFAKIGLSGPGESEVPIRLSRREISQTGPRIWLPRPGQRVWSAVGGWLDSLGQITWLCGERPIGTSDSPGLESPIGLGRPIGLSRTDHMTLQWEADRTLPGEGVWSSGQSGCYYSRSDSLAQESPIGTLDSLAVWGRVRWEAVGVRESMTWLAQTDHMTNGGRPWARESEFGERWEAMCKGARPDWLRESGQRVLWRPCTRPDWLRESSQRVRFQICQKSNFRQQ